MRIMKAEVLLVLYKFSFRSRQKTDDGCISIEELLNRPKFPIQLFRTRLFYEESIWRVTYFEIEVVVSAWNDNGTLCSGTFASEMIT